VHVEERERHEDRERHHLLDDLQLRQRKLMKPDPIRRHLQHVLEQRNPPADERRHIPRPVRQIPEVRIPREGHEDIRRDEQADGDDDGAQSAPSR